MSYPVILYPKLLVDFRRSNPLHQPHSSYGMSSDDGEQLTDALAGSSSPPQEARSPSATQKKPTSLAMGTINSDHPLGGGHCIERQSTSPNLKRLLVSGSLIFGLLGFNLVAVKSLPQNLQQPIRVVSLLGAIFAIGGIVGYNYKRGITTDSEGELDIPSSDGNEGLMLATPPQPGENKSAPNAGKRDSTRVSKQQLLDYLEQLKVNLSGQVIQPIGVSDAPVGRSEDAFASVLERYFPGRVRRQLEFPIPQSELGRSFSTDFAVVLEEIGLYIDVEIDEPFDLKKKRPTHCIDDYHDRYRNGFFLQGNWIIIRFAEEQVVRYPKSCCREIASCVFQVTGLDKFLKPLAGEPTLQPIPQWTKKQAKALAKRNYRDTYLSLLTK